MHPKRQRLISHNLHANDLATQRPSNICMARMGLATSETMILAAATPHGPLLLLLPFKKPGKWRSLVTARRAPHVLRRVQISTTRGTMISLRLAPFTLFVGFPESRRGLKLARRTVRRARSVSSAAARAVGEIAGSASAAAEVRRSIDAHLRPLAPEKMSEDDRLVDYETLLVARFLDILQDLHGSDFRQVVEECLRLSGEYHSDGDPARLDELGALLTSLEVGDAIMVASSFSHMLNLANIAEETQMVYRKKAEKDRSGIDETFQ
ncbi:uncharacterized protein LOC133918792 [Phragmites australis]|uniref:uncharacterized protein LOC133918792 n=1 Tax=Phragmites australis TaxID=29695 RepID=UPI002D7937B3|nr:uncharacterized protein LOC133918792 [Phragmites australis]